MRHLKVFPYVHEIETVSSDLSTVIVRTPSPLDAFVTEESTTTKGTVIRVVNDIGILFNQQRLSSLNPTVLSDLLNSFHSKDPESGLTDDQILSYLKSRYIQSQTDIYNWSRYISSQLDTVIDDIKQQQALKAAAQQQVQQSVDPPKTE